MTDPEPPAYAEEPPAEAEELTSMPAGLADEQFAINIREARERKGWSQSALADQMRERKWPWWAQTVQKVEAGQRHVRVGEAEALARIFGTTMERLTWPGRAASAAALMEMAIGRAESAWEQIAAWTASLLWAQGQLGTTVAAAEADDYLGSPQIREIAEGAAAVLAMTPEGAMETGRKDHARMRAEGDDPYEDEDRLTHEEGAE